MRKRPRPIHVTVLGLCLAFVGLACSGGRDKQAASDTMSVSAVDTAANRSLYDRLGGKSAITAVVDTFVARVAADVKPLVKSTAAKYAADKKLAPRTPADCQT